MKVSLVNDGPVTIIIDTKDRKWIIHSPPCRGFKTIIRGLRAAISTSLLRETPAQGRGFKSFAAQCRDIKKHILGHRVASLLRETPGRRPGR